MDRYHEQRDYDGSEEQHGYGDGEEEDEDAQQLELEQEQAAGEVQCEADIEAAGAWSEPPLQTVVTPFVQFRPTLISIIVMILWIADVT